MPPFIATKPVVQHILAVAALWIDLADHAQALHQAARC